MFLSELLSHPELESFNEIAYGSYSYCHHHYSFSFFAKYLSIYSPGDLPTVGKMLFNPSFSN